MPVVPQVQGARSDTSMIKLFYYPFAMALVAARCPARGEWLQLRLDA